jgi:muramoyltetrapeptide carboxypeptidase
MKIGIVAPAARLDPDLARRLAQVADSFGRQRPDLHVLPQCYLSSGHFAGDDRARAASFVEVANDASFDALWIARGGYGCCRILDRVLPALDAPARAKTYLGYSDAGFLLAALYGLGFPRIAHGPMPTDLSRDKGERAVARALSFLIDAAADSLEPTVRSGEKVAAFNITVLCHLIGTPWLPDLDGHILLLEEVAEYMYAIDRSLFHLTSHPAIRRVAGIMLGRCQAIPDNHPAFGQNEEQVVRHWCEKAGIPYRGRADIGHDVDNKVVPFGDWRRW